MLGHDDVSVNAEAVGLADTLQGGHECFSGLGGGELRLRVIATERQEMVLTRLLETLQSPGHVDRLFPQS